MSEGQGSIPFILVFEEVFSDSVEVLVTLLWNKAISLEKLKCKAPKMLLVTAKLPLLRLSGISVQSTSKASTQVIPTGARDFEFL